MSDILDFLRVPFTLIVGGLIASLIYKYFVEKKVKEATVSVKKEMEKSEWKSPQFSNGSIYLSSLILFITLFNDIFIPKNEIPYYISLFMYAASLLFVLIPHSIQLNNDFIEIQPLLLGIFNTPFLKRKIFFREIRGVKKQKNQFYPEYAIGLEIKTYQGKIKVHTEHYSPEIPTALYDVLKSRAGI